MKKLLLLLVISSTFTAFSQSTQGKDFWFGYISNLVNANPDVYISAEQNVTGTISVPGLGWTQNFNITAGTTQSITLPNGAIPPYTEGLQNMAVHVTSCDTITVYAVNPGSASADATIVYPTSSLSSEYTVLNMTGSPGDWGDAALIVATADNTQIQITPSVGTGGGQPAGVPFTITLNQGEMYQLTHPGGNDDLTGTVISGINTTNCLPFAVFSGSQCINIGGCGACDHLYEQLLPTANLGSTYAAIPLSQKPFTIYRVLATQNNTNVFVDGALVSTLNAGNFFQFNSNNFSIITSSNPVAVMQYAIGNDCGGPGDPMQVLLYPVEQSLETITFNAFQTPLVNNYWVNILVLTANVGGVVLDGANISANFTPFPSDPTYSYARINIGPGDHTLTSVGGALANVYGWGGYESFGYCAGAAMKNIANDFDIVSTPTCVNDVINFTAVPDPQASGFQWDFGDGSPLVNGSTASHSYSQDSSYSVTLIKLIPNGCDVNIVKTVDIFKAPIHIDQADTVVCAGATLTLNVPLNAPVPIEQVSGCGDTIVTMVSTNYDTIYWSTGASGNSIQVTPNSDTTIYVYGENFNSPCTAIDSVFIEVQDIQADFSFSDVCLNDSVCLTNQSITSNSIANSTYYFNGNTLIQDSLNYCFLPLTPGLYDLALTVETSNGCSDSIMKQVEIFNNPTANFTFTNSCFNTSLEFESTSSILNDSITQNLWDVQSDNSIDYTDTADEHDYPQAGFYDITYYAVSSNGCRDTITQQVTVYPLPDAQWSVNPVCEDTLSSFVDNSTITPVDNDLIATWEWDFGDGSNSVNQSPDHAYGSENLYNASLIVTTNHNCKDTLQKTVTVWPLPEVNFNPTEVCLQFETPFQDESTISNDYTVNSNVQWDWDFGDGSTSSVQNPSYAYQTDGIFNATLTVTSNNGCVNDTTLPVTVNPKPEASFEGINLAGCSPICPEIISTSQVDQPSTIDNYEWRLSDGSIYESSSPSYNECFENLTGNDITYGLELMVTTEKGCKDTLNQANYISVYHNPIASFNYSPNEPNVIDSEVSFSNSSLHADSYIWTIFNLGNYTETNPIIVFPLEPESYSVQLVALTNEGCTDTAMSVVTILDQIVFYVPNTFTPDSDNFNEVFKPIFTSGFDPMNYRLLIFNRWGEVIYESNDASVGWNGTYGENSDQIVKDGTYIWKIEFKETMSDKRHTESGHVNVLK